MTGRDALPDPGRDGALTAAARIFGNARHIPRRDCLGCGGSGGRTDARSWDCDAKGPTINGATTAEWSAWSRYQYARFMFDGGYSTDDPGPEPAKPRGVDYEWTYTFTWSQVRERAEALAVGEQVGAFEAAAVADATPEPERQDSTPEPAPILDPTATAAQLDADVDRHRAAYLAAAGPAALPVIARHEPERPSADDQLSLAL